MTSTKTSLAVMKEVAASKTRWAGGSPGFVREIEKHLDVIALAQLNQMAPVNENLLGLAYMLLAEVKRQRAV